MLFVILAVTDRRQKGVTTAQGARMGPTKKAGWSDNLQDPLEDGTPPAKPQPAEPNSPFREATCDRAWAYVAVFRRVPGKQEGKKGPVGATVRPRLAEKENHMSSQPCGLPSL